MTPHTNRLEISNSNNSTVFLSKSIKMNQRPKNIILNYPCNILYCSGTLKGTSVRTDTITVLTTSFTPVRISIKVCRYGKYGKHTTKEQQRHNISTQSNK